jgi:hypothetical protein
LPIFRYHNRERASSALIEVDEGAGETWEQLTLKHESGPEIAVVERNPVAEGELGAEELKEFLDEVPFYRPSSAAIWLTNYLLTVKVIYAFQLLSGTDVGDGWTPLHGVYNTVWKFAGPILQADGEGLVMRRGTLFCGSSGRLLRQAKRRGPGRWWLGAL